MRSAVAVIIVAAALSACAHNSVTVWMKPGASQADFTQARYNCMQQSQQSVSTAFVNQYGGAANNRVITNDNLFGACMNAQGWSLQQQPSAEQRKAAMDALVQEARELCTRPDLQPFFSKTACMPEDTTLEQMADKSRISASEKVALDEVRTEALQIVKKTEDAIQQYNPQNATVIIARLERAKIGQDKLILDFYDGHITRGEFNTRRKEMAQQLKDDLGNSGPGQRF